MSFVDNEFIMPDNVSNAQIENKKCLSFSHLKYTIQFKL